MFGTTERPNSNVPLTLTSLQPIYDLNVDVMPYAHGLIVKLRNDTQHQKISVHYLAQAVSEWRRGIHCHHCLLHKQSTTSLIVLCVFKKGHGNVLILCQQRCPVGHSYRHFWCIWRDNGDACGVSLPHHIVMSELCTVLTFK